MQDLSGYSDQELLTLMKADNRSAFTEIYSRHWSKLMLSAYQVLKDKEICKDIIQDVFTDLYTRRKKLLISSLPAYLKVAVRNRVFQYLRNENVQQVHLDVLEKVSFVHATEQMVNYNQLNELYERSVNKLPEKCREVFLLSRVENLSLKEIAERLDISPKTVENQITKALKYLRKAMDEVKVLMILLTFS